MLIDKAHDEAIHMWREECLTTTSIVHGKTFVRTNLAISAEC